MKWQQKNKFSKRFADKRMQRFINENFNLKTNIIMKTSENNEMYKEIVNYLCSYWNVTSDYIMVKARPRTISLKRQYITKYLKDTYPTISWGELSLLVGTTNHATAINSFRKMNNYIETDKNIRADYAIFEQYGNKVCKSRNKALENMQEKY